MANEENILNEELTAEQLEDLAKEAVSDAVADEELDEVAGGAGAAGTKLYVVVKACTGFNTALLLGRKPIASLRRGLYLKNCRLVKVLGSGDWVNYAAFGSSRNGPWTAQNGWTEAYNCNLLAY